MLAHFAAACWRVCASDSLTALMAAKSHHAGERDNRPAQYQLPPAVNPIGGQCSKCHYRFTAHGGPINVALSICSASRVSTRSWPSPGNSLPDLSVKDRGYAYHLDDIVIVYQIASQYAKVVEVPNRPWTRTMGELLCWFCAVARGYSISWQSSFFRVVGLGYMLTIVPQGCNK